MSFSSELEKILIAELEVLKELEVFADKKSELIIANDIEQLEALTKNEEALVNQIGSLEVIREKMLDEWGVDRGTSISSILERMPEENGNIASLRDEMLRVTDHLRFKNDTNDQLLRDNLDWIEFNVNLITNATVEPNYGKENKATGRSLFDRKV